LQLVELQATNLPGVYPTHAVAVPNRYVEETPFASMLIPKQHSFLWRNRERDQSGIFHKHLICKRCLECCWVGAALA